MKVFSLKKIFSFVLLLKFFYYSKRIAKFQVKDLKRAEKYCLLLDKVIAGIKVAFNDIKLSCDSKIYDLPVSIESYYFRPLFKMATHKKLKEVQADDSYAVDFDVPISSRVKSVSSGKVVAINKDGEYALNSSNLVGKDNYVYVYNEQDKKIFCYRHIKPNENINLWSYIKTGEEIGEVDNSGYSITSHLHFVIYDVKNEGIYRLKSKKIKFIFSNNRESK